MANDLAELRATISDDLAGEVDAADSSGVILRYILEAISLEEGTRFWFNEIVQNLSTVAGTAAYSYTAFSGTPYPILQFLLVRLNDSGSWVDLEGPVPYSELKMMETNVTPQRNMPTSYGYANDKIEFWPVPDAIYPVEVHCIPKYADLAVGTDANVWTTEAKRLIAARACELLCRKYLKDPERAVMFRDDASAQRRMLLARTWGKKLAAGTDKAVM